MPHSLPNSVQLYHPSCSHEEVDSGQVDIPRRDDEGVANPDHARGCQSNVLRNGKLLWWAREILDPSGDEAPLHDGGPEED